MLPPTPSHLETLRTRVPWPRRIVLALASAGLGLALSYLPWGAILKVCFRLLGVALTGPHMFFIGACLDARLDAEAAKEAKFEIADDARRAEILHEERMIIQREAEREIAGRGITIEQREASREGKLIRIRLRQFKALADEDRVKPILHRSHAIPLPHEHLADALERQARGRAMARARQ